uniref:Trans-enoyl reductase resD n=1 Tax=Aspergillus sclerotiorum TaxID=138282 RepID=RESD_ASPSL
MQAIISTAPGQAALVHDRPLPTIRDGYLLVKTKAVALNPTDWKHIEVTQKPGILFGCDYAGIVEQVGPGVQSGFQPGDRVAGFVHGGNSKEPQDGAFAEYIVAKADLQIHIPEHMSFEEAATLGVGITAVGQGLYQTLSLPFPSPSSIHEDGAEKPANPATQPILIYGASTASGVLGIQFAKLSGFAPLAVCSPDHFDLAERLGAVAVFDYADGEDAVEEIQDYVRGMGQPLLKAWDTISIPSSARFCGDALSSGNGPQYASLLSMTCPRPDVTSTTTMAYTVFGEDWGMGTAHFPASGVDAELGRRWWALVQQLLNEGRIQTHRIIAGEGGLDGVLGGLQQLRDSQVRGGKLVFRV